MAQANAGVERAHTTPNERDHRIEQITNQPLRTGGGVPRRAGAEKGENAIRRMERLETALESLTLSAFEHETASVVPHRLISGLRPDADGCIPADFSGGMPGFSH